MNPSLLIELFTEELPPKALKRLGEAFASGILAGLTRAQLRSSDAPGVRNFATPRRLAAWIPGVMKKAAGFVSRRRAAKILINLRRRGFEIITLPVS